MREGERGGRGKEKKVEIEVEEGPTSCGGGAEGGRAAGMAKEEKEEEGRERGGWVVASCHRA